MDPATHEVCRQAGVATEQVFTRRRDLPWARVVVTLWQRSVSQAAFDMSIVFSSRISRRTVLMTAATAAGALVVGARFTSQSQGAFPTDNLKTTSQLTAWVRIASDNSVTLLASQSEMGQGTTTTLAAALAHELFLPLERVELEFAPFDPAYRDPVYQWMFTGNSQGTSSFYDVMRRAGAAAREMLVAVAADRLGAGIDRLDVRNGTIVHRGSGRSLTFGQLAADAARVPVPASPRLRRDELRGRRIERWDIPSKVDGSAVFGIDVRLPGMLVAAVRSSPRRGGRLARFDAVRIKQQPGVVEVVELSDGLAVVGNTYWQVHRALSEAQLEWHNSGSTLNVGDAVPTAYTENAADDAFLTHKAVGETDAATAIKLQAEYWSPFQAHATMEPMNCTADVTSKRADIWVPTQGVELAQAVVGQLTGLPSDKITVHRTLLGGGFGRRLLADFVKQAVMVSMRLERPVKLIWSREEDMTHDFYRPGMLHRIAGAVNREGRVLSLEHHVVSPSHLLYVFPRTQFSDLKDWTVSAKPPQEVDIMAVEGLLDIPYDIPHQVVRQRFVDLDIPVSVWRTTGHGPNNFGLECFIDELAHAAGHDPLTFRVSMLSKNPRAQKLLGLVAEKIRWGAPVPDGNGRGIALAGAFGGLIACAADVSVKGNSVKLNRIVSVVDCGRTLDPRIAESNILGGIVWGLSAMRTQITFRDGVPEQANFDAFDPLHLWETPPCEVYFVDGDEKLGGTGELGPVPVPAAVCNAIFVASGKRVRSLPLSNVGFGFA